ncbi:MAG: hypothetical protein MJ252_14785 [archaeon]|nr:hypothetical protein [archaeon]
MKIIFGLFCFILSFEIYFCDDYIYKRELERFMKCFIKKVDLNDYSFDNFIEAVGNTKTMDELGFEIKKLPKEQKEKALECYRGPNIDDSEEEFKFKLNLTKAAKCISMLCDHYDKILALVGADYTGNIYLTYHFILKFIDEISGDLKKCMGDEGLIE